MPKRKLHGVFPSYKMMEQVYDIFQDENQADPSCEIETLIQQPGMKEEERESFCRLFQKKYLKNGMDR